MTTLATPSARVRQSIFRAFQPRLVTRAMPDGADLPEGVCGRVTGVALVYGVEDSYGTSFAPGCLDRTKREKLAAGKVSLFADHAYGIRTHVGVVRTLTSAGSEEMLMADLFDTEDGRHAKEYLEAVIAARGYTGFSIGFYDRTKLEIDATGPGETTYTFTEIELDEVSITPRPAVPGADVVGVRADQAAAWRLFETALATLPVADMRARLDTAARTMHTQDAALTADSAAPGHTPAALGDDAAGAGDLIPGAAPLVASPPITIEERRAALAALYGPDMEIV